MLIVTSCEDCRASTVAGGCLKHRPGYNYTAPALQTPSERPFQCPVCLGTGHIPAGFYSRVGVTAWTAGTTQPEKCRSCVGTGIVWG